MDSSLIIHYLTLYQIPALFVGAFFFGETVILAAALLAQQGWWNMSTVFVVSFIATVVSDAVWFWLGTTFFFKKKWFDKYEKKYKGIVDVLDRKVGHRPYLSLLVIKFLYGTRIITILYLAVKDLSFWKFILFDTIGTLVWLVAMLAIGWFAGNGIASMGLFGSITKLLSALVVCILVYRWIEVWITKNVTKK
jgi:membrane protein DedA with SNARE-associated domain